jgi:hypothetical protein
MSATFKFVVLVEINIGNGAISANVSQHPSPPPPPPPPVSRASRSGRAAMGRGVLSFGKHKGMKFRSIRKDAPAYHKKLVACMHKLTPTHRDQAIMYIAYCELCSN